MPFNRAITALMKGQKPVVGPALSQPDPRVELNRRKIIKDAMEYLTFLIWWQLTYDDSLQGEANQNKADEIRQLYNDLRDDVQQLCDAIKNNDIAGFDRIICNRVLPKIQNALKGTKGAASVLLNKLLKLFISKGANGLWELVLSNAIGSGFVKGSYARVNAILGIVTDLVNAAWVFISDAKLEEATRALNQALCRLHAAANAHEGYHLVEGGADIYQVTHPAGGGITMKSTTVKPLAFVWKPTPGGEPGEGTWERRPLTMVSDDRNDPNPTEMTFTGSGDRDPERPGRFHEFIVNMPELGEGENKAYVVYQVTRRWCDADGESHTETINYFRGVIVSR